MEERIGLWMGEGCWGAAPIAHLHFMQNDGTIAGKFWQIITYMMNTINMIKVM